MERREECETSEVVAPDSNEPEITMLQSTSASMAIPVVVEHELDLEVLSVPKSDK